MKHSRSIFILTLAIIINAFFSFAQSKPKASQNTTALTSKEVKLGTLVTESLTSDALRENRIGLDPKRSVSIYLPRGYNGSTKRYPVIYFFHSLGWSNDRMFAEGNP